MRSAPETGQNLWGILLTIFNRRIGMKTLKFGKAFRMGQLNMIQHNLTGNLSDRNARRLEKKQAKLANISNETYREIIQTEKEI